MQQEDEQHDAELFVDVQAPTAEAMAEDEDSDDDGRPDGGDARGSAAKGITLNVFTKPLGKLPCDSRTNNVALCSLH